MAKSKGDGEAKVSKRKMVDAAYKALGDAGPSELQSYIKTTYGEEVPVAIISSYKSQLKKKLGLGRSSTKSSANAAVSGNVDLQDVLAVKQLADKIGAAQIATILKLFA
jgi:hypothetical protein